jgi:hypothetical protein
MRKILIIEKGSALKNMFMKINESENYKILKSQNIPSNNNGELPDLIISDFNSIKNSKLKSLSKDSMIPFLLIASNKEIENHESFSGRTYFLSKPLTPDKVKNIINKIFVNNDGDSPW